MLNQMLDSLSALTALSINGSCDLRDFFLIENDGQGSLTCGSHFSGVDCLLNGANCLGFTIKEG